MSLQRQGLYFGFWIWGPILRIGISVHCSKFNMENVENVTMAKVDNNASDYMDPWIVVPLYFGCGLTTIVCKFLSIKHGFNFAPEGRPITWLNIIDQVKTIVPLILKDN